MREIRQSTRLPTECAALFVAAGLLASCATGGNQGVPSGCGGQGQPCCGEMACNAGLTCTSGYCSSASEADATSDAATDDAGNATTDTGVDETAPPDASLEAEAEAAPVCVPGEAGCMTTNPGACAAGTPACDDAGVLTCEPLQTTQPCYTGPPATRNVGRCKDGTQSCVGSLGACTGEVLPALHDDCFTTTDDDCDGTVGNGCPLSLLLGPDRALTGAGGPGGGPSSIHCPAGAYVTRVDSWFDDPDKHASGVSIYCATPSLVQGATSYSVMLTPNAPAPYQTVTGSNSPTNERQDDCGVSGLTAITYTVGLADTYVEGLGNHCGTSPVTLQPDNTLTFTFATTGDTSYNTWPNEPGTFFDQACNPNEVVVGFNLHSGLWLDNVQPVCAALLVKYK